MDPGREPVVEATMMRRPNLSTGPGSVDQARFSIDDGLWPCCDGVGDGVLPAAAAAPMLILGISVWMTVLFALTIAAAASGS